MTSKLNDQAVFILLALSLIAGSAAGSTGTVTVRGAVLGQDGQLLSGARVIFSSSSDSREMIEIPTAASAAFVVSLLPGAGYKPP